MTGGIIQLAAYGKEDLFLSRDPQITFFKVIYRRHTNFSREEIPQNFIHDLDFGKRRTCLISPEGDLAGKMCLKITLPSIPKISNSLSSYSNINVSGEQPVLFSWVKYIGFALVKTVEIEINDKVIDRHYGEWLYIWSILTTKNISDQGFNKLIGNVPELTDFSESKDEYVLYIPFYFWFCRSSGLSLPLVALQFSDIKINVELNDLENCYIVTPTHYIKCDGNLANFKPFEYLYQKGPDNIDRFGIFSYYDIVNKRLYYTSITPDRFVGVPYDGDLTILDNSTKTALLSSPKSDKWIIKGYSSDFSIKPDINAKSLTSNKRSFKNVSIKDAVILVDYIYLDDDERFKFAQNKNDYLIEQLYFTPNLPIEGTNPKVKLDIDQPCKLTVWLAQLDYINNYNDIFNYTNSHVTKKSYDNYDNNPTKFKQFNSISINDPIGQSLIDESTVRLNSQVRLSNRTTSYYQNIQPFQHTYNYLPVGCNMYSYSLNPVDVTPSGTTNMSQIDLIELNLKMNYVVNSTKRAKFRSYSLCYNVWRVDNGLSALIFIR